MLNLEEINTVVFYIKQKNIFTLWNFFDRTRENDLVNEKYFNDFIISKFGLDVISLF